ncbi:MAG: CCA tRNA nucleotidyltransferase [Deltaproteobacteria bacterium]|nr:CCA tRNA nucleotidyltransferase [Deltaproteobacteria bacterium]
MIENENLSFGANPPGEPRIIPRDHHCLSRKQIDPDVVKVLYRLHRRGYLAYLVGGSVRDLLLGHQPKDFDIGTDATPAQIRRLFRNCFLIGRRFRLAVLRFPGNKLVEVTTFRRHPGLDEMPENSEEHFNFVQNVFGSPRQDAFRRDFTINALFYDISNFSIVDHVGGMEDLEARRIRVIGDPPVRFREDPVRMLRALEFAVRLDFALDPAIGKGIDRCASLIAAASPARIREELQGLFQHKISGKVLRQARESGLLPHLLPGYQADNDSLNLLQRMDEKTLSPQPFNEAFGVAAMFLSTFMAFCSANLNLRITEILNKANTIIDPYCRYFSVAKGIKHDARELLVSCYRFARGPGLRGEKRFLRNPNTPFALELFSLWEKDHPEVAEQIAHWRQAICSPETKPTAEKIKARHPRRSRRKQRPQGRPPRKPRPNE